MRFGGCPCSTQFRRAREQLVAPGGRLRKRDLVHAGDVAGRGVDRRGAGERGVVRQPRDHEEPVELGQLLRSAQRGGGAGEVVDRALREDELVGQAVVAEHLDPAVPGSAQIGLVGVDVAELRLQVQAPLVGAGEVGVAQRPPPVRPGAGGGQRTRAGRGRAPRARWPPCRRRWGRRWGRPARPCWCRAACRTRGGSRPTTDPSRCRPAGPERRRSTVWPYQILLIAVASAALRQVPGSALVPITPVLPGDAGAQRGGVRRRVVPALQRVEQEAEVGPAAGRAGRGVGRVQLGLRDGGAEVAQHHDLRVQLGGDEPAPVDGRSAGEDAVVVVGERLRDLVALTSAGREAVPVRVALRRAVEVLDQRLGLARPARACCARRSPATARC